MLENVHGLRIEGRCFGNNTNFQFYPNTNDRMSILYGRNGSGKSTISEGLSCIKDGISTSDLSASLVDAQYNSLSIPEDVGMFVFNEQYVDRNLKIEDDGLGTIVLLGGQVDVQKEIDKKVSEVSNLEKECECIQEEYNKYIDSQNPLSPQYHWNRINASLKQVGGWAEVDSKLKGNRRNTSVTDDVITEICGLTTKFTLEELKKQFDDTHELLDKIAEVSTTYPEEIRAIAYDDKWEDVVIKILSIKIEEPILTEREKAMLDTIKNSGQSDLEQARQDFSLETTVLCPYCYQHIDKTYKESLIKSINTVLNKDVDEHKDDLSGIEFPVIGVDLMKYDILDPVLIKRIEERIQICQEIIAKYKDYVDKKQGNIYTPITISRMGLLESVNLLNDLLKQLEDKRKEFNNIAGRKTELVQKLVLINKLIAHSQTELAYGDYKKQTLVKKKLEDEVSEKQKALVEVKKRLKELEQQKVNTGLAIKNINDSLDYVFFETERLSIELKNDRYYLKSNGKDVKPKTVSQGERNIIALCYFFTHILSNQDVLKLYNREMFVVIDDPVSSFDFENKVGIVSFMRLQISRIINGNQKSKILVLSHDLEAVFNLRKALEEICSSTKGTNDRKLTYTAWELSRGHLNLLVNRYGEYKNLLMRIYRYADGNVDDSNITIGNIMRRVLEAFSTFNYQKGIEQVSCDKNILEALGEYSVYFENLMYRLVLHGESHYEEQVKSLHDGNNFFKFISEEEKQKTARNILCFIHLLNPFHLVAYLNDEKDAVQNIQKWVAGMPKNSAFSVKTV